MPQALTHHLPQIHHPFVSLTNSWGEDGVEWPFYVRELLQHHHTTTPSHYSNTCNKNVTWRVLAVEDPWILKACGWMESKLSVLSQIILQIILYFYFGHPRFRNCHSMDDFTFPMVSNLHFFAFVLTYKKGSWNEYTYYFYWECLYCSIYCAQRRYRKKAPVVRVWVFGS